MSTPHALIVDDSKTAQLRLKRMLEAYDLHIDVVFSAEEALAYLSYRAPVVIFLDQSMKGMDGIEALKTIKANPATAMIPVIMYTSEQGHVFTGQARALGALDILYKSGLKPSSLEKVLEHLKITPRKAAQNKQPQAPSPAAPPIPARSSANEPSSLADLLADIRAQVARLFEIHIADVGRQIDNSTQFITRRINAAQEQSRNTPAEIVVGDVPLSVLNDEVSAERRRVSIISHGLLITLLIGLLALGVFLFQLRSDLIAVNENYQTAMIIAEMNATQIQQLTADRYQTQASSVSDADKGSLIAAVSWAANTDLKFGYNEEPLSASIINKVQELIYLLAEADYHGVVELRLNFGNVCMAYDEVGNLVLAAAETPIMDCVFRDSLNENLAVESYLSLPYLSFEQLSPVLREGNIGLAVSSAGFAEPRVAYPELSQVETAGQWNQAALENNYISLAFNSSD